MKIKPEYNYIDVVFENCDYIRIYPKDIRFINIQGITDYVWTNCVNQYVKGKTAKSIIVSLKNETLLMKTEFEKRDKKNKKTERFKECLDRVKDITHIEIKHKPDSLYVGVPWSGKSHYTNKSQKVVYEKDGTFTIEIV